MTSFLTSRGVTLPAGNRADTAASWSVHGLAKQQDLLFKERLARDGVRSFPGTVALIERLRSERIPVAVATSSRNSSAVLALAWSWASTGRAGEPNWRRPVPTSY